MTYLHTNESIINTVQQMYISLLWFIKTLAKETNKILDKPL